MRKLVPAPASFTTSDSILLRLGTTGDVTGIGLTGNSTDVLRGDGTFGPSPGIDHDWYEYPGGTPPNNINDTIYTYGHVGINTLPSTNYTLYVYRPYNKIGPGQVTIYGYRAGTSGPTNGGTGWTNSGIDAAIKGYTPWGNQFTAGVAGFNFMDYDNSAGVIGGRYNGDVYGILGLRTKDANYAPLDASDIEWWGGYFWGNLIVRTPKMDNTDKCLLWTEDSILYVGSCNYPLNSGDNLTYSLGGNTTVVDYVADFDNGSSRGTAVGVGSIEYFIDGEATMWVSYSFSPISAGVDDLGWSTTANYWNEVYAQNFVTVSSEKLKRDIQPLTYGLAHVMRLRPVLYRWKSGVDTSRYHIGLIAEEVHDVIPEAVVTGDWKILDEKKMQYEWVNFDSWGISYQELIPVLVRAIQEQQQIIQQQQKQLEQLQREVELLKQKLRGG